MDRDFGILGIHLYSIQRSEELPLYQQSGVPPRYGLCIFSLWRLRGRWRSTARRYVVSGCRTVVELRVSLHELEERDDVPRRVGQVRQATLSVDVLTAPEVLEVALKGRVHSAPVHALLPLTIGVLLRAHRVDLSQLE
jgi:hypothetical protein